MVGAEKWQDFSAGDMINLEPGAEGVGPVYPSERKGLTFKRERLSINYALFNKENSFLYKQKAASGW